MYRSSQTSTFELLFNLISKKIFVVYQVFNMTKVKLYIVNILDSAMPFFVHQTNSNRHRLTNRQ